MAKVTPFAIVRLSGLLNRSTAAAIAGPAVKPRSAIAP